MISVTRYGLSKRDLDRHKRVWRRVVREAAKHIPVPRKASVGDVIECFAAAIDELNTGRKIVTALASIPPRPGKAVAS